MYVGFYSGRLVHGKPLGLYYLLALSDFCMSLQAFLSFYTVVISPPSPATPVYPFPVVGLGSTMPISVTRTHSGQRGRSSIFTSRFHSYTGSIASYILYCFLLLIGVYGAHSLD